MNYKKQIFKALRYTCLLAVIVLGLVTIIGTGGSNDNDNGEGKGDGNSLSYQGITTPLTKLYFIYSGSYDGAYDYEIMLILAPVAVNPNDGFIPDGRYVYLEIFFPTSSETYPVTYTWSTNYEVEPEITIVSNGREDYHNLSDGTVTIAKNGSTYTINGQVTATQGPATFSYVGPLTAHW